MAHQPTFSSESEDEDFTCFEKFKKKEKRKVETNENRKPGLKPADQNFTCTHCGFVVITSRGRAGVNNRNHCPRCLCSRHVDEDKPGDRAACCRSRMEPAGLTTKQTLKRYGASKPGELMLIHRCAGCGKFSINRLAADDDAYAVYQVFQRSLTMCESQRVELTNLDILLLESRDLTTVYSQLFGWQAILEEFQPGEEIARAARVEVES